MKAEEYYKTVKAALVKFNFEFDDDILQELVTNVFIKMKNYDFSRGSATTYIYSIVRNDYLLIQRKNSAKKRGSGVKPLSLYKIIYDNENIMLMDLIPAKKDETPLTVKYCDFLNDIQPLIKEPLRLSLQGLKQKEIAEKLNVTQASVSRAIKRNIEKLRLYYEDNYKEVLL